MMLGMGPDIGAGVDDMVGGVNPIAIVVTLSTSKGKKRKAAHVQTPYKSSFSTKGFAVIPDEQSLTLRFSDDSDVIDDIVRILPGVVMADEGMVRLEVSVAGRAAGEPLDEGAVSTCDASWVSEYRRAGSSDDADTKELSLNSGVSFVAPG